MYVYMFLVVTWGFRTKNLYEFLFHACYMPCQRHYPWFCYSKEVQREVLLIVQLSRFSVTSSLLGPYILFNNLFS
jgi:hypothetical protein